ncbi:MAG: hypothetical protein JXR37_37105 [Kiritimatiellae bacterium]|nr:hypothetical protein [Kiritimatiellia bacterium]
MDFQDFVTPNNLLRPTPFWAINDRITPEETARQFRDMRDKGLGGGFFHSRAGLITDYLGEEWVASMQAALRAAEETDGYLWLYDEDLWPSGNAGGQVAALGDAYRQAWLEAILLPAGRALEPAVESEVLRTYAITGRTGLRLSGCEDRAEADPAQVDGERLVIRRRFDPKRGWWSGESYVNLLNPDVTTRFIEMTHEVYKRHFGAHFGKRVPGIFTDEPQLARHGLPWYAGLPARYGEWFAREFWRDLPFMFFEGEEARVIRQSMHRLLLRQFVAAYTMPIFDWCRKNGIAHTGHYNAEDSLLGQITNHGGGIMAHYRGQQIPGVDHLCRSAHELFLTLKQVSSAVRQLGRPMALNEIFGVSHHTNTFEDFKWSGDYSLVQGATFFCPHLTWYSMRGKRKRDYPPNWNYQQTYWAHLRPLNDYFTRLGAVLTAGESGADILVLHPIEAAMSHLRRSLVTRHCDLDAGDTGDAGAVRALDGTLRRVMRAVQDAGYDFDLGDEDYLADLGKVEGGKLVVGRAAYRYVVVPPASTWRPSTYELLKAFAGAGGAIVFTGRPPAELDCRPAEGEWAALLGMATVHTVPAGDREIVDRLACVVQAGYRLRHRDGTPAAGVVVQRRLDGPRQFFFVVDTQRSGPRHLVLELDGDAEAPVAEWDPLSGARRALPVERAKGRRKVRFTLAPTGSILIAVGEGVAGEPAVAVAERPRIVTARHALPERWTFTRSEPNVLVLDRLAYSLDAGATWSDEDLDHRIRGAVAGRFGTRESLGWQPWVAIRKRLFDGKGGPLALRYRFRSRVANVASTAVVIEDIQKGTLRVNGTAVDTANPAWHWDRGFGKVDITELVKRGENEIVFTVDYDFLTEIEAAYVVGDFGVRLCAPTAGELCKEPAKLQNGSWLAQGYPFYSGSMTYRADWRRSPKKNRRYRLRLLDPACTLAAVRVNGQDVGRILWRPYELDITAALQKGRNTIEIEIVSSRQNTHGPLHVTEGDSLRWFGPPAFEQDSNLREPFSLYEYGLLGGAEIVEAKR